MTGTEFFNSLNKRFTALPSINEIDLNNEGTLIVIVDMVNGFCVSGALASQRCNSVTDGVITLLNRLKNAKRAFIRDCHTDKSIEFSAFPPHCHNENESALVDGLNAYEGVDVPKNSTNGVYSLLKAFPDIEKFKEIVLVGVCADICILQLALSLKAYMNEKDLTTRVNVLADLIETYDCEGHEADYFKSFSLALMQNAGINILKSN